MSDAGDNGRSWPGFTRPSYTMVPDDLLDDLMADLSGAEFKVVMYIVRRTIGWRRDADAISLSQLQHGIRRADGTVVDRGTGLSEKTCITAVKSLVDQGVIRASGQRDADSLTHRPTIYSLVWRDTPSVISTEPLLTKLQKGPVKITEGGPVISTEPLLTKLQTQHTAIQQTEIPSPLNPPTGPSVPPDGGLVRAGLNGTSSTEPGPPVSLSKPRRRRAEPPPPGPGRASPRLPVECATWRPEDFAKAWDYWGKRGDVGDAGEAWDWLQPSPDDMALMKKAIKAQRIAYGWGEPDGQVQPYFSTFIRKGHWRNISPTPGRVRH